MLKTLQIELDKNQSKIDEIKSMQNKIGSYEGKINKIKRFSEHPTVQFLSYQINQYEVNAVEDSRVVTEEEYDEENEVLQVHVLKRIQNPTDDYRVVILNLIVDLEGYCELETRVGETSRLMTRLTFTKQPKYMKMIIEDFFKPLILSPEDVRSGFLRFEQSLEK